MTTLLHKLRRYAALIAILVTILGALCKFAYGAHVETAERIHTLEINTYAICVRLNVPCLAPPGAGLGVRTAANP